MKIVLATGCLLSTLSTGQECDALNAASAAKAADYLQHAGDDPTAAACVQIAFHQIAASPPEQAIPLLITYLGYKRPLNEGERHGIFMHGNGPSVMYPAVHELYVFDKAAEPAIGRFIAENRNNKGTELENAVYTLLLIHHGNALSVVQALHRVSASSTTVEARDRLQRAATDAVKWCDEGHKPQCEDALK